MIMTMTTMTNADDADGNNEYKDDENNDVLLYSI